MRFKLLTRLVTLFSVIMLAACKTAAPPDESSIKYGPVYDDELQGKDAIVGKTFRCRDEPDAPILSFSAGGRGRFESPDGMMPMTWRLSGNWLLMTVRGYRNRARILSATRFELEDKEGGRPFLYMVEGGNEGASEDDDNYDNGGGSYGGGGNDNNGGNPCSGLKAADCSSNPDCSYSISKRACIAR
jgi:hypothetical protein